MKSTGVVRKIDSLGRIVIPKEIRRSLGIKDGEDLEIFLNDGNIILNKASSLNSIAKFADIITDIIYSITKKNIVITDRNVVLSANKEILSDCLNKDLSSEYLSVLEKRNIHCSDNCNALEVISSNDNINSFYLVPIVVQGELKGSLLLFSFNSNINDSDKSILKFVLKFLEKNLED